VKLDSGWRKDRQGLAYWRPLADAPGSRALAELSSPQRGTPFVATEGSDAGCVAAELGEVGATFLLVWLIAVVAVLMGLMVFWIL
jgi:hypothetical protein